MIQEFALYSRTFTIAEPDDFVPNLPDPAVSSAWRRVLDRVHIVLDEWEGTDDVQSPAGRKYTAELTYSPGWVCLSVRHPSTDGPTQIEVMHGVAMIIEEETRGAE